MNSMSNNPRFRYYQHVFLRQPMISLITILILLTLVIQTSRAGENVVLRESFAGSISFELAGNSLRNASNECQIINSSSDTITLPGGSTVKAAYLYWAGSGQTPDTQVILNGTTVTADNVYSETFYYNNQNNYSFGAKADVTSLVSGSGTYTVSGLTFDTQTSYCNVGLVFGGWAMVMIYDHTGEPNRVINLFDGFKGFQSSAITLTPNNFIVDTNPAGKGGKHAHITWEGDAGNSQSNGGYSETLAFNGTTLVDSNNPSNNQFNSYSNIHGDTSGVDIDEYNIGSLMNAGDTSVTTLYSSGQDFVLLTAEVISVPNVDVADLELTASAAQSVIRGNDATYTLTVTNHGPKAATSGSVVSMPLTDGLTLSGYSGSNWTCTVSSNTLNCIYNTSINNGATASSLTILLGTAATTQNSIDLTATVSGNLFDNRNWNNSATLSMTIGQPDFSSSSKSVQDINGGVVSAGDTLRYSITLTNTGLAASSNASISDSLPANIESFTVFSMPAGAVNNSSPAPAGTNNTGLVQINGISVNAGASATVIIDAVIATSAASGNVIINTASINDGFGNLTNVTSPSAVVSQAFATTGNKPLYLQPDQTLSRVESGNTSTAILITGGGSSQIWPLAPALSAPLTLNFSNGIPVQLMARNGRTNRNYTATHQITAELHAGSTILASGTANISLNSQTTSVASITMSSVNPVTVAAGTALSLYVSQSCITCGTNTGNNRQDVNIYASNGSAPSQVSLTSYSVINVDSLSPYNAAYPSGSPLSQVLENSTIYLRASVSDPFGYADITSATLNIHDPDGNSVLSNQSLSPIASSGSTNIYEYSLTVPNGAIKGNWGVTINSVEGYEGLVTASYTRAVKVTGRPIITVSKSQHVLNDPVNGLNNPKAIPGAEVLYTLTIQNSGEGGVDTNSLIVRDSIPALTPFFVGDLAAGSPVEFVDGTIASGLTFIYQQLDSTTDDIDFSNNNGSTFDYVPVPDGDGYDFSITDIRLNPKGPMNEASTGVNPEFSIHYKVRVP
jgi:trimeric autotransporter adhesin